MIFSYSHLLYSSHILLIFFSYSHILTSHDRAWGNLGINFSLLFIFTPPLHRTLFQGTPIGFPIKKGNFGGLGLRPKLQVVPWARAPDPVGRIYHTMDSFFFSTSLYWFERIKHAWIHLQCFKHNNQLYFITWHHNTQQLTYVEVHRSSSYMGMFNLGGPQKWANDAQRSKLWKNIKSSETLDVSTVPILEGLPVLQKYKWVPERGGPENDKVSQSYIKK